MTLLIAKLLMLKLGRNGTKPPVLFLSALFQELLWPQRRVTSYTPLGPPLVVLDSLGPKGNGCGFGSSCMHMIKIYPPPDSLENQPAAKSCLKIVSVVHIRKNRAS